MIRNSCWFARALCVLSIGLWFHVGYSKGAEALIGTISGAVTDKDGQKLEGMKVHVMTPHNRGDAPGRDGARRPPEAGQRNTGDAPPKPPADAPPTPPGDAPPKAPGDAPRPPAADSTPPNRGDAPRGPVSEGARRPRDSEAGRLPPPPSAEGYTDKDGAFTLNLPAGEYVVVVMERDKGFARAMVTVEAEKTATVSLKLEDRPSGEGPRREGGARQGRPDNGNPPAPRGERPPKPE
jgi:hypothetical protein